MDIKASWSVTESNRFKPGDLRGDAKALLDINHQPDELFLRSCREKTSGAPLMSYMSSHRY
jgi:hypothetical protein